MKQVEFKEAETIKVKILELIEEWAHDEPEEQIYVLKNENENETTFSSIEGGWNVEGRQWEPVNKEQIEELVQEGIKRMMQKYGFVYVYICKDNRIVSLEGCSDDPKDLEDFKDHVKMCYEVIPELYYEGWD